ncbi:hypothetical protein [Oceanobacillus bengalensis]|uniref:Uncharacterized protein n=2 Tax=Oceanobacillus bengalensis TaxID=1435466 RepID=A0A494Z7J3_9BACI|nr:hypothetical protein D8M05_00195 [Oceanobacillus bengalensis]
MPVVLHKPIAVQKVNALSTVVYTLVGIGGIVCIGMLFAPMEENRDNHVRTGSVNYSTEFGEETIRSNEEKRKDYSHFLLYKKLIQRTF